MRNQGPILLRTDRVALYLPKEWFTKHAVARRAQARIPTMINDN